MTGLPTIKELAKLITSIKPGIDDSYVEEPGDTPSIQITVGWTPGESWGYQTGDNSLMGGAYLHPMWAVGYITRRCNARELAKELIDQLKESEG